MLYYALVFFVIALIAFALGFSVLGGMAATVAKVLAILFVIFFVISLLFGRRARV